MALTTAAALTGAQVAQAGFATAATSAATMGGTAFAAAAPAAFGLSQAFNLGSAILNAAGTISQGQAAADRAEFESTVQRQQATRERRIAAEEERDFRRRQSALLAKRRAALGGSGVSTETGTPLIATEDFLSESELQALRIREGGAISATRLEQQASLTRAGGKSAKQRGFFRAGASLLSGMGEFG